MPNHSDDDLHSAIREGDVDKVSASIATFGLSYSNDPSAKYVLLCEALNENHATIAKILLEHGFDVNYRTRRKLDTPLHIAVRNKDAEIVAMLLDREANVDAKNHLGETPLHLCLKEYDSRIVSLRLSKNADVNAKNDFGRTTLRACAKNRGEMVTLLLRRGADINARTNKQSTALHLAAGIKSDEIVKILLKHEGVDIDAEDRRGKSVLHIAIDEGCVTIVEDLLRHGANVDSPGAKKKGYTLLHIAVIHGQLDIAEMLIKHGADVKAIDKTGKSPISYAVERVDAKMAKLLVSSGAEIKFDPNVLRSTSLRVDLFMDAKDITEMMLNHDVGYNIMQKDIGGQCALWSIVTLTDLRNCRMSCCNKMEREDVLQAQRVLVDSFLSRGAKVDAKNEAGESLLLEAFKRGRHDLVYILLRYNADVNCATKFDMKTPLHYSVIGSNEGLSRMLLNAGAAVNAKDKQGKTALHYACENRYFKKIDTLLKFGAEIDHKDNEDCTPLYIAASNDFPTTVETLLKSCADVKCTNKDGETALHVASKRAGPEVIKELLDYGADPNVTCKKGWLPIDYAAHRRYVQTADTINQHIIKIKSLNIHDSKRNLHFVELNRKFADFQSECELEIGLMMSERIGETNLSYYDVLMKSINQLAMFARNNDDVLEILKSSIYREKFPIYYKICYYKFEKGQKRGNLLSPSLKSLNCLWRFPLPELVSFQVLNYLSDKDLENLMKIVPQTENS